MMKHCNTCGHTTAHTGLADLCSACAMRAGLPSSNTTTTPTPIPDVAEIEKWFKYTPVDYHDSTARDYLRSLLSTIPADTSSAAYALWLMAQGYKIRCSIWGPDCIYQYCCLSGHVIVDQTGKAFGGTLSCHGCHWEIYTPPPAVDDKELRRKCVDIFKRLASESRAEGLGFTPAELQRLKELQ